MGDVTLTIDADTARYIASIAKAAEATKGLNKPVKETNELWEAGVEVLGSKLMKLSAVGAAVGAVKVIADGVGESYRTWIQEIENARRASVSLNDEIRKGSPGSLAGAGAARTAITGMRNQLSLDQRGAAFAAYKAGAPGATDAQALAAVDASAVAELGGIDPAQFAGASAKLRRMEGGNDIAALAFSRGGSQGGAIVDLLAEITAKSGADQARNALPVLLGAAQTNGGLPLVQQAYGAFTSQGRAGDFADTFQNQGLSLVPGLATRQTLAQVNAAAASNRVNPNGYLSAVGGAALNDPLTAANALIRENEATKAAADIREKSASGVRQVADQAVTDAYGRGLPSAIRPSLFPQLLERTGYFDNASDPVLREAAQNAAAMRRMSELIEEQTDMMGRDLRPAIGTQGEGGR